MKRLAPVLIVVLALVARVGVRLYLGEQFFWDNGYTEYYMLGQNIATGRGFCFSQGCAYWPPLYPLFLALTAMAGKHYLLVVIPQALVGAVTSLCAFFIGKELFGERVGTVAGFMTALYPYYVIHDGAIQETGLATLLAALSVLLMLRASASQNIAQWFASGLALGALLLTRASFAPSALLAVTWVAIVGTSGSFRLRSLKTMMTVIAMGVLLIPWLIRTDHVVGAPMLSSQTGRALWIGNNPQTFSHYPAESMDKSEDSAYLDLTLPERTFVDSLSERDAARWFMRRGLSFIQANKKATAIAAGRKVLAGFSWALSPDHGRLADAVYELSYAPVAVLGIVGMALNLKKKGTQLVILFLVAFTIVTAVFWAHTSHRSHLDVYLIVFAASVICKVFQRHKPELRFQSI